uniref:Uncharacterized protein n=1 Tax=Rhizophora mucronata TaxID=61149 RepID=A0A2P2P6Z0_RHIMU
MALIESGNFIRFLSFQVLQNNFSHPIKRKNDELNSD